MSTQIEDLRERDILSIANAISDFKKWRAHDIKKALVVSRKFFIRAFGYSWEFEGDINPTKITLFEMRVYVDAHILEDSFYIVPQALIDMNR